MNLLTDPLPDTVSVEGRSFEIVTDFRPWIEFEARLMRTDIQPEIIIHDAVKSLYVNPPEEIRRFTHALFGHLIWFYRCGRPEKPNHHSEGGTFIRAYDFEQDAPMIVAAFQQAYGIDLTTASMHWWRFRALFEGLPDDCRICKIMEYRTADTSDMPENTKALYDKMKAKYQLEPLGSLMHKEYTVEERNAEFIKRLRRGE